MGIRLVLRAIDGRKISTHLASRRMVRALRHPIGTTARTGEKCPESGDWQVVGTPTTTAPIAERNVMPPYRDRAVTWRLVRYA